MPKIIKGGVNFIPDIPQADGITITDSEGVWSAVQQVLPVPDNVTIVESEGIWSAVQQEIPQPDEVTIVYNQDHKLKAVQQQQSKPDWEAVKTSEGFIENKPKVLKGSDYDHSGVAINDTVNNNASGINSFASGSGTNAIGLRSHAEGYSTSAEGENSHAEGESTKATAKNSHAEGVGTITPNLVGAHVQGRYNVAGNFIDTVGYGSNASNRKNISALTTDGRLVLADSVTIGADNQSQGGYTFPIPAGLTYGVKYVVTFSPDSDEMIWEPFELEDDPNRYKYNGSTSANPGPFTIYDGTTEPASSLGKPGDIYFKHS